MAATARAERLIIDEDACAAATQPNTAASDDFSVQAIAAKAEAIKDGPIAELASLFHSARFHSNWAASKARNALAEARALYPDPPAEICGVGRDGVRDVQFPAADWPAWRVEIFQRWERQCALIRKGMGVEAVEDESEFIDGLRDELGHRATEAEVKTLRDAIAKLGVIRWRVELEDLEGAETSSLLSRLDADLTALAERE